MQDITKEKAETIVEQEVQDNQAEPIDHSLITEVKEKPYHPIFPGMDVEKPEANQIQVPTLWLLGVLVVCFFVIKKFIYIPDGDRHNK